MLTTKEFAEASGVPYGTLRRWRSKPHGTCEGRQGVLIPAHVDEHGRCFYDESQIDRARRLHNPNYGLKSLFEEMNDMTDETVNPLEIDAHNVAGQLFDAAVPVPDNANAAQVAPHAPNDSDDAEPVTLKQFFAWCSLVQKIRDGQLDNVNRLCRELKDNTGIIADRQQLIDLANAGRNFKECLIYFRVWLAQFNLEFVDDNTGELRKLVVYEDGTCGFENVIDAEEISAVVTLEQRAEKIRRLQANVQREIIEIGNELIAAKNEIGHGNWTQWLKTEFQWTPRTAQNFMAIAERFGKNEIDFVFKPTTLIQMLALPVGSEDEFIAQQAESGKPVNKMSTREVKAAIKEFNQRKAVTNDDSTESPSTTTEPAREVDSSAAEIQATNVQDEPPHARDDDSDVEVVGGECKRICEGKVAAIVALLDDDEPTAHAPNNDVPAQVADAGDDVQDGSGDATRAEIAALLARVEELILDADDDDALTVTKAGLAGIVAALEKNRPPLTPTG